MPFRSPQQLQELMLTGVDPHTQQHCSPAEITSILIDECVQDFQVEHEARVLLQRITNKCIGLVDSEEVMGVHLVDQIFRPCSRRWTARSERVGAISPRHRVPASPQTSTNITQTSTSTARARQCKMKACTLYGRALGGSAKRITK